MKPTTRIVSIEIPSTSDPMFVPETNSGTLIFVIPVANGLVLVGDSYSTRGNMRLEARESKIGLIEGRKDLAVVLTGSFTWTQPLAANDEQEAEILFSGRQVARDYLAMLNFQFLNQKVLGSTGQHLATAMLQFLVPHHNLLESLLGCDLCRLTIAQFTATDLVTRIGNIGFRVNAKGAIEIIQEEPVLAMLQTDDRFIGKYGEVDYVDEYVMGGIGREYLRPDLVQLMNTPTIISSMTRESAIAIAQSVIRATEQTMEVIPGSSFVGGTPTAVFIDGRNIPQAFKVENVLPINSYDASYALADSELTGDERVARPDHSAGT